MDAMVRIAESADGDLFNRIGRFLADHHLSAEPAHYAFVHELLSEPLGMLAQCVAALTDGGVRLSHHDIARLGGEALAGAPVVRTAASTGSAVHHAALEQSAGQTRQAEALIARAELQVRGFSATVRSIHAETTDFGRDLAASAAAIRGSDPTAGLDAITHLTSAMIERVHDAECRLASAERECDGLRVALEDARSAARRDPLTELANRRAFDEALAALPPGTPVVFAVCDVDHFKRVNDEFGHAIGDRVLRAVGQTIAAEAEGALVARYGGEEFAVLLVDTDLDAALTIVDRARSAVAARRFRTRESDAPIGVVTISGGIAAGVAPDAEETLYARADAALYRAKAAGRNRVFRAA